MSRVAISSGGGVSYVIGGLAEAFLFVIFGVDLTLRIEQTAQNTLFPVDGFLTEVPTLQ